MLMYKEASLVIKVCLFCHCQKVTRVEPHQDTKPFRHHQLQPHMFMFKGTALLARQEHFRMSTLVWEFA